MMNFSLGGRLMIHRINALASMPIVQSLVTMLIGFSPLVLLHASPSRYLFDAPLSHYMRGAPQALVLDDFNEDGQKDVALMIYDSGAVIVGIGTGDGTFMLTACHGGELGTGVAAGDVDNDGHTDLVVSYIDWYDPYYGGPQSGGVAVLMGNGDGSFTGPSYQFEGDTPAQDLVLGDLNGDGRLDLAVALIYDDLVAILLGQGDGTFTEPSYHATGSFPTDMIQADLDSDGDTDLAVANSRSESVSILLNNGDGTYPVAVDYPVGGDPVALTAADLDGSGGTDLALTIEEQNTLSLLFGTGTGGFSAPVLLDAGNKPRCVAAGDLDGDGHTDLAVGSDSSSFITLFFNEGSGEFSTGSEHPSASPTADLAMVDLDLDGDQDLCLASAGVGYLVDDWWHFWTWGVYGRLTMLLNHGGDGFSAAPEQGVGQGPTSLELGHLDGDAVPDLVAVDEAGLFVLRGNGDATFGSPVEYAVSGGPENVVLGDLNGDGNLDAAAVSSAGVSLLLGNGDGTLADQGVIGPGGRALRLADLDLDGDLDIVLNGIGSIQFLLGNGDGTFLLSSFTVQSSYPIFSGTETMAVGALNGDGIPDLVRFYQWTDEYFSYSALDVWHGVGDGTFTQGETYQTGADRGAVEVCDLDQDGHQDLILAMEKHNGYTYTCSGIKVDILWGNGDGTFTDGDLLVTGVRPSAIFAGDLDGDGLPDLAVTGDGTRNTALLINMGGRVFQAGDSFGVGWQPNSIDGADLDGDGDVELVVGNVGGNSISILRNTASFPFLATGPGVGETNPPLVRLFDLSRGCTLRRQWSAYGVSRYGVNVACADLDGDGQAELLTGPGPGTMFGPHVRGYRSSGHPLAGLSFLAYGTHRFGVNVSSADLDGDGVQEILTGAGPGEVFGPHVRGWSWDGTTTVPIPGVSYLAYGTPRWGVNVAGGDIDGDGIDEIITGAGPGPVYGPHVRGWNCDGGVAAPIGAVSYLAYGTLRWGVHVTAGDVDGDGIDEIVTGAGPSGSFAPNVRGWNWDGSGAVTMMAGFDFIAYNSARWGVNVTCGDLDGDGVDDIVTGCGPGSDLPAHVRGWRYAGEAVHQMENVDFLAYDPAAIRYGVKVAVSRQP